MKLHLLIRAAGLLVLAMGGTLRAQNFSDTEVPNPPATGTPWVAPEVSPEWARAAKELFDQGMADPRGCDYRQIKVITGSVWSLAPQAIQTHGWVLPILAGGKPAHRFAVCWNGLVYPTLEIGEACSLQEDVDRLLEKTTGEKKKIHWETQVAQEDKAVSYETLNCLKIPLILRVGNAEIIQKMAAAWEKSDFENYHPYAKNPDEDPLGWSQAWMFQLFIRGLGALQRGDDNLAILSFQKLEAALPGVAKDAEKFTYKSGGGEPFNTYAYLKQVPAILTDLERRQKQTAIAENQIHSPDQKVRIAALILALEDVAQIQGGQPGGISFGRNATVKALINEGPVAVEPLLDCLATDTRLTRCIHFWRDFVPSRTVLGVQDPAYTALSGVMETSFITVRSTGEDLSSKGPEERAKVAAAMREYWNKTKDLPRERVWLNILADDRETPEHWLQAAQNIVRPASERIIYGSMMDGTMVQKIPGAPATFAGEPLRTTANPGVSTLLLRRIGELAGKPQTPALQKMQTSLAEVLKTWNQGSELPPP
ncbi:MAG: hypothetical protein ABI615_01250 [Chthoniobacterales bacterium]